MDLDFIDYKRSVSYEKKWKQLVLKHKKMLIVSTKKKTFT